MKYDKTPYPSIGEIIYEVAVRSGLVLATDDHGFYDELKAFKDDRKRPALDLAALPTSILYNLEERLAAYIGDERFANTIFVAWRRWLEFYAGFITRNDAGLLDRRHMSYLLWPTTFGFGASLLLRMVHEILPIVPLERILSHPAPFGCLLEALCTWGRKDYKLICEHRSRQQGKDFDNCMDTLGGWLKGKHIPNLDRAQEVLDGLGLGSEFGPKLWVVAAKLLHKTPLEHREAILGFLNLPENSGHFEEAFFWRKRQLAWEHGEKLGIGPDRPYSALREALYDPQAERSPMAVEDMLSRLERTWAPIASETYHIIEWFRGRHLVLSGKPKLAMPHYQKAYELGVGRDSDIFDHVLPEALALAGKLNRKKLIARFDSLLGLHMKGDWDGDDASLGQLFEKHFDKQLFYV